MAKTRIQVYADEETKRRIELAAAKKEIAITQYCLEAIRQQLAEDDMLDREKIEIPIKPTRDKDLIADLRALHKEIKTDCSVNGVYQGKTYCFGNEQAKQDFMKDPAANLAKAQEFYKSEHKG